MTAIRLPGPVHRWIDGLAEELLHPAGMPAADFSRPRGEAALVPPDSMSWRIFKNPISLLIGGVAAVILELAEPRVRAGVWGHTSFRTDPVGRLQRTGLAAMITVYGARSQAEAMIAGVNRRHARITGKADDGRAYTAVDPQLLDWVQATAGYGFIEAHHRFVHSLSRAERDRAWTEAEPAARLYGATGAPASQAEWEARLHTMVPHLTASPIIFEFLDIMRRAPAFPKIARPVQRLLIRAAIDITPPEVAAIVGIGGRHGLTPLQRRLVGALARAADRLPLRSAPPAQACIRLGLPSDMLYRRV